MGKEQPDEWWWDTWAFSATISEVRVATWAKTQGCSAVEWVGSRRWPWDVQWENTTVDVKDAFIETVHTPDGLKVHCVGFMGSANRVVECRPEVSHYGLVVRNVSDGPDRVTVTTGGDVSVQSQSSYAIYLVPNQYINEFFHKYRLDGAPGKGRNVYQTLTAVEEFKVFDSGV